MKKKLLLFGSVAILAVGFFAFSCSEDDDPVTCEQLFIELSSAKRAYLLQLNYNNCIAYKNALEDYINCDGATDTEIYQTTLDNLDCSLD